MAKFSHIFGVISIAKLYPSSINLELHFGYTDIIFGTNSLKYGQIVYDISENLGVLIDKIYGEDVDIPGIVVSNDEICVIVCVDL